MNCKQGDLAAVVGSTLTPELIGWFVVVQRRVVAGEVVDGSRFAPLPSDVGSAAWVVTAAAESLLPLRTTDGIFHHVRSRVVLDRFLRPIRDNDGEDETLTWAGKPEQVTA